MKANICNVCLADFKEVKPCSVRISFRTTIGRHIVDLCKEHEKYIDERGFQKIRTENEAEFYKLLTDMMHKAQSNYHQLTHHPDIATELK